MIKFTLNKNFINSTILSLFGIGTIIVCFYIFFGLALSIYFALIAYSLAFSFLTISYIRNAIVLTSKYERVENISEENEDTIKEQKSTLEEDQKLLIKKLKKSRSIEITKAVFSGAFAIFTLIVLILF